MWSAVKSIFRFLFPSNDSPIPRDPEIGTPNLQAKCADPRNAFKTYDDEFYADISEQPDVYTANRVTIDQKKVQEKFLDIVKYYNDVIMTNSMVFSEDEVLEYQKKIFRIEKERRNYSKCEKQTYVDIDGEFFKYIIKKVENLQSTLGSYNKQLSFFYNKYKLIYDWVSIVIIFMSSSLSLIEGITLCFSEENTPSTIVSLIVSTSIAVMTSVLKFKNYKEKLEELVKLREKIHNCQAKLFTFDKELKTTIFLSPNISNNVEPAADAYTHTPH
jgi:hypothetical protein